MWTDGTIKQSNNGRLLECAFHYLPIRTKMIITSAIPLLTSSSPPLIDFASTQTAASFKFLPTPINNIIHDDFSTILMATNAVPLEDTMTTATITNIISTTGIMDVVTHLPPTLVEQLLPPVMPDVFTITSTIAIVTVSDMVPFVPCQPLAIALGSSSTFGVWAYPICVVGQTLAGVISFLTSRYVTNQNLQSIQETLNSLSPKAQEQFTTFRQLGSSDSKEGNVLLALIGLRLAPFFPFSAGNYLLGSATSVGLRPFVIATIFGCLLSNFLSVILVGVGGSELVQQVQVAVSQRT